MNNNDDKSTNDINTFGNLEDHLYTLNGGVTYFQRHIQKSTPFSKKTFKIEKTNGSSQFGYTQTFIIDKNRGHYLSNVFVILTLPSVKLTNENLFKENGRLRWCNNLFHNIIDNISLSFNDQIVSKLDSFSLDFLSEFDHCEGKYSEYMKNIGNIPELVTPQKELKSQKLVLPIPFFFSKNAGANIPLFALKRTEIKISITYKSWENVLIFENASSIDINIKIPIPKIDIEEVPEIEDAAMYSTVTWVKEEEIAREQPNHILIENLQSTPRQSIPYKTENVEIPLFFKNAIRRIYFGISNTTYKNCKSVYGLGHGRFVGGIYQKTEPEEVLERVTIKYGENIREDMDIEFYKFINPYFYCNRVPSKKGMYAYCFAINGLYDPSGSANINRVPGASIKFKFNNKNSKKEEPMEIIIIGVSHVYGIIKEGLLELPVYT